MKKSLNYVRFIALGIFVFIMLEQQFNFHSQIVPMPKGPDFVSQQMQLYDAVNKVLPLNGTYRIESDSHDRGESNMQHVVAQYSLAPRIISDSIFTDTVVCNFSHTLSINNPQNPYYANRAQWTVIEDNGTGIMVVKKNK
jgi:hypothetical protein